ncbi:MAG: glutathione S-transferase N-terminal domain-containing protein [Solirubrobacteraceae bacterium]
MILYTCPIRKSGAPLHPCARAAKALDGAGHAYELRTVAGGTLKLWTWHRRERDRAEIRRLSGQLAVPILVLGEGDGEVVVGSADIVRWAREHSPQTTAVR